jgi:hypothetical protein
VQAPSNAELADLLERVADLLEAQHADGYRVRAYQGAARTLRDLSEPASGILGRDGLKGLEALPGIGRSIASSLREYVETGRLGLLDRLEGQVAPEDLFTTVPGLGEDLARRVHEHLGIETLEDLEHAAHDGRLEAVPGFGPRRVRGVREALAAMLSRSVRRRARRIEQERSPHEAPRERPSIATVLAVDEEYRTKAAAGRLRRIAPRRFNPDREAWLPVLHAERDGWSFTAMYSNTALAHRLGRTQDWVVLYFERDGDEDQCTVVTEPRGALAGRRVVRGREEECRAHHRDGDPGPPASGG